MDNHHHDGEEEESYNSFDTDEEEYGGGLETIIQDPFEAQWRRSCCCGGAKRLNSFDCYMKSEGGCGSLPLCPNHETCGGVLFLKQSSRYDYDPNGGLPEQLYWGCSSSYKKKCKFSTKSYIEHEFAFTTDTNEEKEAAIVSGGSIIRSGGGCGCDSKPTTDTQAYKHHQGIASVF